MKTSIFMLSAILFIASADAATADTVESLPVQVNRQVALEMSELHIEYAEHQWLRSPRVPNTEKGWAPGFGLSLSYLFNSSTAARPYVNVTYDLTSGSVEHRDYNNAERVQNQLSVPLAIQDLTTEAGAAWLVNDELLVAGVAELEVRSWRRSLTHDVGLDRIETYTFVAPGAAERATIGLTSNVAASAKVGLEYTSWTQWVANGNPVFGVPPSSPKLGSKFLLQGSVGLDFLLSNRLSLKFGAGYSQFDFGHSEILYFGRYGWHQEPNSSTEQIIGNIGLGWLL